MIEVKEIYPYINNEGIADNSLILHYSEDEFGQRHNIRQIETGYIYEAAVDIYPCPYTYEAVKKVPVEEIEEAEEIEEIEEIEENFEVTVQEV